MRPPEMWINRALKSTWETPTACRVVAEPGSDRISRNGRTAISPPRTTAAHTWMWIEADSPAQVYGDSQIAKITAATHWIGRSTSKRRSTRRWLASSRSAYSSSARISVSGTGSSFEAAAALIVLVPGPKWGGVSPVDSRRPDFPDPPRFRP